MVREYWYFGSGDKIIFSVLNHLGAEYLRHTGHQLDADLLRLGTINLAHQIILKFSENSLFFFLTFFKSEPDKECLPMGFIAMFKL